MAAVARKQLPLRPAGPDTVASWLSEIMLQQTTVKAAIPYFAKFLARWPAVEKLAEADLNDVLAMWAGLGYYTRARNLHACAITVVRDHGGRFPETEKELLTLGDRIYDYALCNMALFDMVDIEPLFRRLPKLLKPGGSFVFSLMHPAFNNSSSVHVAEEQDKDGLLETTYSVKISRYLTPYQAHGVALRNQPKPQIYFERPIQYYFDLGFKNGFVLDGFAERAFPADLPATHPLSWGGHFSDIPPVLVARMRLI